MYYVYYIKGKKVGCTKDLKRRVEQEQGYKDYLILFESEDIKKASKAERYFQEKLGYRVDTNTYEELINNNKNKKTKKMIKKTNDEIFIYNQSLVNAYEFVIENENIKNQNNFDNIREWAKERGIFDKGDSKTQYIKLQEEAGELAKALLKNDRPEIIDAIGDIAVVLTNLAHLEGLKIEDCIQTAYDVISKRQGKMVNGTFVKNN
jgi:NTP pyrophosphatase (non-canonical NTP hydrolase)